MLRSRHHLTFALSLAVCSTAPIHGQSPAADAESAPSTQLADSLVPEIATFVTAHADLDMFSGTVLVARQGEVIYEGAFGEADKDHDVPNRLSTRFNVGSIGKTFTAVAIMKLRDAGQLRLSDPLGRFLPEYPFPERETITVHHLLTHTAGLGDYLEHKDYQSRKGAIHSVRDALPMVYEQAPQFPPGEQFQYSNSGYLLLGAIIEKASGLSYRDYLREQIFAPLGMEESDIVFEDEILPERSIGYTKNGDGSYTSNVLSIPAPCPAGGLRTTARDLLKFDQALYGTTLLSDETKALMFAPSELKPTYACGWEVKEYADHPFTGHSGGANGIEAYFYRFVEAGYTVITLANYDGGNGQVCAGIEAILFGQEYSVPTVADAHFTLGYALQSEGKYEEAVRVFARNLSGGAPHLLSLFLSANSRISGDFDLQEAVAELDRYIDLAGADSWPPVSMAWGKKATAYKKLGDLQSAAQCYRRVLELDPQNEKATEELEKIQVRDQ